MKRLTALLAGFVLASAAHADKAPLAKSGSVKHAAYMVCRSAAAIDLGEVGSDSSADCDGVVRTKDGAKTLDNLAIRCLENSVARKSGYKFTGTCVETDADGDKLYLAYEGPESGPIEALGGTGKFEGISGKGQWTVADAPGNTANLFVFTFDYGLEWTLP